MHGVWQRAHSRVLSCLWLICGASAPHRIGCQMAWLACIWHMSPIYCSDRYSAIRDEAIIAMWCDHLQTHACNVHTQNVLQPLAACAAGAAGSHSQPLRHCSGCCCIWCLPDPCVGCPGVVTASSKGSGRLRMGISHHACSDCNSEEVWGQVAHGCGCVLDSRPSPVQGPVRLPLQDQKPCTCVRHAGHALCGTGRPP